MKTTVIIIILGVCLVGATAWAVIAQNKIQVQEAIIGGLQATVAQQKASLDQARKDYNQLMVYYNQVRELHAQSQRDVVNLNQEVAYWKEQMAYCQQVIDIYEREVASYKAEVERAKFAFYYASLAEQRYGVDDLQEYLERWEWIEGAYTADIFDCSQMSAYLEWKLENEGYHTVIAAGEAPWGDGKHAWLLVETSAGHYMPVEATAFRIVYWWEASFDNYFAYHYEFETIQQALGYSPLEFNWWE